MRIGVNIDREPDPLIAVLAAGGVAATPRNLSLLRATLEALRNQDNEQHRPRPGVRQPTRETEFYLGLARLYRALGGPGALGGEGGPYYRFCRACADIEGIKIVDPATFRKQFSGENIRKRPHRK
jgi:hypothetical protein